MQESFVANQNFKNEWKDWRNGKLDKKKLRGLKANVEPKSVADARNLFFQKNDLLYSSKIEPLERKFKENPIVAVDEVIEFLSVDITAFRCGYAKEVFLHWLKQIELSLKEIEQLQRLAIEVCETGSFRREFRRWCRLMIKLADGKFVINLQILLKSENHFTRIKSKWMIEAIQKHRLDLRNRTKKV